MSNQLPLLSHSNTFYKNSSTFFWLLVYHFAIYYILRYTEVANNVQKEETLVTLNFVFLDCSPLKFSLLSHCNEWQNGFTRVLKEMATNRLTELHAFLKDNSERFVLFFLSAGNSVYQAFLFLYVQFQISKLCTASLLIFLTFYSN